MCVLRAAERLTDPASVATELRRRLRSLRVQTAECDSLTGREVVGPPWRSLSLSLSLLPSLTPLVLGCQDVSVPALLHGAGGVPAPHQGLLLGAAGDPGVRRDRLPADAPGRRGAAPPPLGPRREPADGRTPAPALGERPAVDGAVLHRGAGPVQRRRRGAGGWRTRG